ncbi:MAG: hypothetical protein RXR43_15530 [Sulfolobus sp.]
MTEKIEVQFKDGKYPFIEDRKLNVTDIGDRQKGRMIFISGRFVIKSNDGSYVEFERVSPIALKLTNAKFTVTEKGTYVVKYEQGAVLYIIELPSGYRGSVSVKLASDECKETVVLRSPRGSLGEVKHLWCNYANKPIEIQYSITGRTRTAGYGNLVKLFGENTAGKIIIEGDNVKIVEDEELDKLI